MRERFTVLHQAEREAREGCSLEPLPPRAYPGAAILACGR